MLNSNNIRTWITCASYAILNTIENSEIDLIEFENSTGVSFGVASHSDQYHCTRMLTPYRKFWDGISLIEKIWGLHINHICTATKNEMITSILSLKNANIIIGPINMATLYYLPLSSQYKCADHYITLHINSDKIYLTDSENIPYMRVYKEDLNRILDISDIMEADGKYNAGIVENYFSPLEKTERLFQIIKIAGENFKSAEENGQGGKAFLQCQRVMKELSVTHWETPIRYDLNYYLQRKYMLLETDPDGLFLSPAFKEHILFQILSVQEILFKLYQKSYKDVIDKMQILSETETAISYRWKELTTQL